MDFIKIKNFSFKSASKDIISRGEKTTQRMGKIYKNMYLIRA